MIQNEDRHIDDHEGICVSRTLRLSERRHSYG